MIITNTPESAPVGSLEHLRSWQDVVALLAVERRAELGAAVALLPSDSDERARLELLLHAIDKSAEAAAAFRAQCVAAEVGR